jgi:ribonuclease HII
LDIEIFNKYDELIGCDEVGRGPIAGPVNGCAVRVSKENLSLITYLKSLGVTDSKKLTTKKRLIILEELGIDLESLTIHTEYNIKTEQGELHFVVGEHSPADIDNINILQASLSCMKNASIPLVKNNSKILIDGNKTFEIEGADIEAVVKGDSKSTVIALASIIAKEYRDLLMQKYDMQYPGYGLARHAGYPTKAHKEAVSRLGITPIHRKSFKGVKEYV